MAEGRIPQSFIDEVLLRTDIVDLVDGRVKLKRAGKNYTACCPFHTEKSPSFTVNREKQFYYCFGCGASGNAISFLMEHDRLDFIDGLKQLAGAAGLTLPETREGGRPRESHQPLFDALEAAATWFEQQLRQAPAKARAVDYLKRRGVTGQVAKAFRLGYAPPGWDNLLRQLATTPALQQQLEQAGLLIRHAQRNSLYDAMRDRVIFPIRDFRGRVIAFGGRVLNDDKPKYLNSPESPVFHKGQELYGLHEARQSGKLTRLLVVEGYMDVVALAQHGIPEAVATLGTATSSTHVERLFRVVPEVVFCFDGDAAGRRAAWRALENALPALKDGVSAKFLFLPDGEDPDSLVRREGPELFRARISAASVPLTEQLFRHLMADIDTSSLEGRSRLASEALPLLATVPESLFRTLLVQRLSELTQLQTSVLDERLQQLANKAKAPPVAAPAAAPLPAEPGMDDAPPPWLHAADDWHPEPFHAPDAEPPRRDRADWSSRRDGRQAPRPQPRDAGPRPVPRSLSAQAIRLLLRDPSLATGWPLELLSGLQDAETALLQSLVGAFTLSPDTRLATLLGRWHGTPEGEQLGTLAAEEWLIGEADTQGEARDLLRLLRVQALELEVSRLHDQLQRGGDPSLLREMTALKQRQAAVRRGEA